MQGIRVNWVQDMLNILGTDTDISIAKRLGIGKSSVRVKREELGIPPRGRTMIWTPEMLEDLGKYSDRIVAEKWDIGHGCVNRKRAELGIPVAHKGTLWTQEMLLKFGMCADHILADEWGLHRSTVAIKRRSLGIPPLRPLNILPKHCHSLANSRGFKCLDADVLDAKTKLWWQCSEGHRWQADYNKIQQGRGCPECAILARSGEGNPNYQGGLTVYL